MKTKYDKENLQWATEVLGAYNIVKRNKKDGWLWARQTVFTRHKSKIFRRNLNFKSFTALITPLCRLIQPKKKKIKTLEDIIIEGAEARDLELKNELILLCRDDL
jgi:hypothetical protein